MSSHINSLDNNSDSGGLNATNDQLPSSTGYLSHFKHFLHKISDAENDYESLGSSSTLGAQMVSGAAAGLMEHCVMYPIDCVKTRMQALSAPEAARYRNVFDALVRIVREEGPRRPFRGISAMLVGAAPSHALYFAIYENMKDFLGNTKLFGQGGTHSPFVHVMAGCCATLVHDGFMTPADVVKQRIQLYHSPYRSCSDCLSRVYRTEGVRALYRSYGTQLIMNLPFQCTHFVVYEATQNLFNPGRQYAPLTHLLSGSLAGGIAALITTPLDVCKTLLNTQAQTLSHGQAYEHACVLDPKNPCVYGTPPSLGLNHNTPNSSHTREAGSPCPARAAAALSTQPSHSSNIHLHAIHTPTAEPISASASPGATALPNSGTGSRSIFTSTGFSHLLPKSRSKQSTAPFTAMTMEIPAASTNAASGEPLVRGVWGAIRTVYASAGPAGFFRGVTARCLHQMPATAISWSVYEAFKSFLSEKH